MTRGLLMRGTVALLCALCRTGSAGVDIVIHGIDVSQAAVGQAVVVPVDIHGLEPASFAAFQLEFALDPAVYEVHSVERGELIAAEDNALASPDYAPYLWALEAHTEGGVLRVGGLILMPDVHVQRGNLNVLNLARVPREHGELLRLHLVLRTLTPSPITLLAAGCSLLVNDPLDTALPSALPTDGVMPGGVAPAGGLPNEWQYRYFGTAGCDPETDSDGDFVSNRAEHAAGTSPVAPDVRLDLEPGWNLIALPVVPSSPSPDAVLSSCHRLDRPDPAPGLPVHDGWVWGWDGRGSSGVLRRVTAMQPFAGYWVHVTEPARLVVPGNAWSNGPVPLQRGWNLVGTAADVPLRTLSLEAGVVAWGWDPERGLVPVRHLQRGRGYWVFTPRPTTIAADGGTVPP